MTDFTDEQVHSMCRYLKEKCYDCPSLVETSFGPGVHGCYAIAAETLDRARAILTPIDAAKTGDDENYSDETSEQTRFRQYYETLKVGRSFAQTKDGNYTNPFVRDLWEGWQRMLVTERTGASPGPNHPSCDCLTPQPTLWESLLCERCYGRLSATSMTGPACDEKTHMRDMDDEAAKARLSDSTGELL